MNNTTATAVRDSLLDAIAALKEKHVGMSHETRVIGQPMPVGDDTIAYRTVGRAIAHLQEAVNELSFVQEVI